MRYAMRPYTFTASSSPSLIASTRQALQVLSRGVELRRKLWDNATRLYQGLTEMGFDLGPEISPVIAVKLPVSIEGDPILLWGELLSQGVYVNLVLPPAAPGGCSMLRCSLSAAHSPEQIDVVLKAFAVVSAKLKLQHRT
jgi:8-amino-7-oxononanoate synthase